MKRLLNILGICLAAVVVTSCDDGVPCYEQGEMTIDNCMTVYFDSDNTSENIVSPDDKSVTLKVSRLNSADAASVPVEVISGDVALQFPATVDFAAGENTAEYKISLNGLQSKINYPFEIRIAEEYADHYTKVDGTTFFKGNVLQADWIKYQEGVKFYWTSNFKKVTSDIEQLEGQNLYRIQNFMGSGHTIEYKLGDYSTSGIAEIIPVSGYLKANTSYQSCWYLYDEDSQRYISWTPEGSTKGISYLMILTEYYGYGLYTYYYNPDEDQKKSYSGHYGYFYGYVYYSDGTQGYNSISYMW